MMPRRRRLAFTALAVGAAAALLVAVVWYLPSSSLQPGNSVAWQLGWVGGHAFDSSVPVGRRSSRSKRRRVTSSSLNHPLGESISLGHEKCR